MGIKRPKRRKYASEPDFLLACLRYLDAKYPGRKGQRKRLVAFARWDAEAEPERVIARMRELIELDRPFTPAEDVEFDELVVAYRAQRKANRSKEKRA